MIFLEQSCQLLNRQLMALIGIVNFYNFIFIMHNANDSLWCCNVKLCVSVKFQPYVKKKRRKKRHLCVLTNVQDCRLMSTFNKPK